MAILNFPSNPQSGDQYTGDNGTTYIFDGVKWVGHQAGGAAGTNSIQNGGNTLQVDPSGNIVTPSYTFPNNTGTTGQVLKWPSSGSILEWADQSGGSLSLTTETLDSYSAFNTRTNPTLTLGDNANDVTITQAASDINHPGDRNIRIQGARGFGRFNNNTGWGGDGGKIQIYGGLGGETSGDLNTVRGGEGGNIEIYGGDGQIGRDGGDLNFRAGQARMSAGVDTNVQGGNIYIIAGAATDSNQAGRGFGGNVYIEAGQGNAVGQHGNVTIHTVNNDWIFDQAGPLTNNYSYTRTTEPTIYNTSPTVVWTSYTNNISGAKLTIQVEATEVGDSTGWHSQVCEAVIASRGYASIYGGPGGDPVMTVYAVTHTSTVPLVEFTVQRNPTTKQIEVVGTTTAAVSLPGASLRIYSVETATRD